MPRNLEIRFSSQAQKCRIRIGETATHWMKRVLLRAPGSVAVVTDRNVHRHVWPQIRRELTDSHAQVPDPIVLPAGEASKSSSRYLALQRDLLRRGLDRTSLLVGLGGGVVTDVTGFAAATYLRGIPWIAMPTSLLGMVDAAIGGKVGINLGRTKNMVGAFHQPQEILMGSGCLKTLTRRQRRSGLAEVIKYAMIADSGLFRRLERSTEALLQPDPKADARLVARCARLKVQFVEADEKESGVRAALNFGHTLGHGFEALGLNLLHGEAIGLGMLVACRLEEVRSRKEPRLRLRLRQLLQQLGLPVILPSRVSWPHLRRAIQRDKKRSGNALRFVLVPSVGSHETGVIFEEDQIKDALSVIL